MGNLSHDHWYIVPLSYGAFCYIQQLTNTLWLHYFTVIFTQCFPFFCSSVYSGWHFHHHGVRNQHRWIFAIHDPQCFIVNHNTTFYRYSMKEHSNKSLASPFQVKLIYEDTIKHRREIYSNVPNFRVKIPFLRFPTWNLYRENYD